MLAQRVLAAILGIPLILYLTYLGGYFYFGLVALITLAGLREFLVMAGGREFLLPNPVPLAAGLALAAIQFQAPGYFPAALFGFFLLFSLFVVLFYPRFTPWELMTTLWGIMYIAGCLSFLLPLRALENGFVLTLFLFAGIWANDSGAYFVGRAWGKHKLAPRVSPNKTVEGAVGGILCTLAVLSLLAALLPMNFVQAGAAALVLSLAGYAGDLVVSALKRHFRLKDTGTMIPGHGGFLDRFDSLIFAAPLFYFMLVTFF